MRILLAIVHFWNPNGGGQHQSLRSDPKPRIKALEHQLLSLRRLGTNHSYLHMGDKAVYPANLRMRHNIDICIVTDGVHHVLNQINPEFTDTYRHVIVSPIDGKRLGFEAQKFLEGSLLPEYDYFGYLEDDLIINDSSFFDKLNWFNSLMGDSCVLLPQRVEFSDTPHCVDRFYIDGPLDATELRQIIPHPGPVRVTSYLGRDIAFESPLNPHAGCFFLTHDQLKRWIDSSYWQDGDVSFVSPLESAATLGISKIFNLFKPCLENAGWFEIQHYGTSFHMLIKSPKSSHA